VAKKADQQLLAMARRGYEKWLREVRTRSDQAAIERYARDVTQGDTQTFFGFTESELVAALAKGEG
jgi:DNA-binding MurR/RpiR family transcriptional regulator